MVKENLIGKKYGKLKVVKKIIKEVGKAKTKTAYYLCECDCGNLKTVRRDKLKNGQTKSCGCLKINDLSGKRFGKLIAIRRHYENGRTKYTCKCDCGNIIKTRSDSLLDNKTRSCGCLVYENSIRRTHGKSYTRIYRIYKNMLDRCRNHNGNRWHRYGGRGITVCDEWKNSFEQFYEWAMNNGYSDELTIDRINNDGNYEPSNCRWATYKEQANNKSTNRVK